MYEFWHFITITDPDYVLVKGFYNQPIVFLSLVVSCSTAYSLLVVLERTWQHNAKSGFKFWCCLGSIVFGLGVWAMHFTGMLAFNLPVHMSFDASLTAISVLPPIAACYYTMQQFSKKNFSFWSIQSTGLSLAIGIGAMHYLGMEAMNMDAIMVYNPTLFIASIISAYVLAVSSNYIVFQISKPQTHRLIMKVFSSLFMGFAIASMHYIAMAASSFYMPRNSIPTLHDMDTSLIILSLSIDSFVIMLVIVTTMGTLIERKLKMTEMSLADSALRENDLVFHLPDGLVTIDDNGLITRANPMAYNMFEYPKGELRLVTIDSIIPGITKQGLLDDLTREEPQLLGSTKVYEGVKKNGVHFPIESSLSAIRVEDGYKTIFNCAIRDITERMRMEEQLRQTHKLESIGQLAAGIAHEINTPTQYVSDNTSFLKNGFQSIQEVLHEVQILLSKGGQNITDEDIQKINSLIEDNDLAFLQEEIPLAIEQSQEGLTRIAKIVSAMKSFSHASGIEILPTDIVEAIESTITVSRSEWKYVANVETDFEEALPTLPCSRDGINQVILNCIVNAAHAIEFKNGSDKTEKGIIKIAVQQAPPYIVIAISDNGIGMSDKVKHRIFDPFFTTKGVGKGTGQGLSLAYKIIVEKHNGKIEVDTKEGEGTTFKLYIPLKHEPKEKVIFKESPV